MKKIVALLVLSAALGALAGYDDIKPGETPAVALTAVQWSCTNETALAEATAEGVLADFVADESSARALLSKLKGAYETDPIVMCQVGAVSQWVMGEEPCWLCFWSPSPAEGRKVWVGALLATAEQTTDTYVKMVCLDQLRWCGYPCPCVVKRIAAIGDKGDKSVKDFAGMVVRELTGKSIGL